MMMLNSLMGAHGNEEKIMKKLAPFYCVVQAFNVFIEHRWRETRGDIDRPPCLSSETQKNLVDKVYRYLQRCTA